MKCRRLVLACLAGSCLLCIALLAAACNGSGNPGREFEAELDCTDPLSPSFPCASDGDGDTGVDDPSGDDTPGDDTEGDPGDPNDEDGTDDDPGGDSSEDDELPTDEDSDEN